MLKPMKLVRPAFGCCSWLRRSTDKFHAILKAKINNNSDNNWHFRPDVTVPIIYAMWMGCAAVGGGGRHGGVHEAMEDPSGSGNDQDVHVFESGISGLVLDNTPKYLRAQPRGCDFTESISLLMLLLHPHSYHFLVAGCERGSGRRRRPGSP
jgi:hypothetical protein